MKRRRIKTPIAIALLLLSYCAATWIIFNRADPLGSDRPIKLRLAHWQLERGIPAGYEAIIKRYEELHPNVDVEQVIVPSTIYRQWLRSNLTGGTGADLIEYGAFLGNINDVPVRYFEPITELLTEPNPYNKGTPIEHVPWRLTFTDGLWGSRIANPDPGQLYAVTLSQGSMRLFCNRDLLRKITGSDAAPQNLDDFRAICAQIHDYSRRTGRVLRPLAGSRDNALWLLGILMQTPVVGLNHRLDHEGFLNRNNRQAMADYLAGRWDYNQPEIRATLALAKELTSEMRPGFLQLGRDDAVQEFARGEAVFIFTGTWDKGTVMELSPFPVEVMRFPQPSATDSRYGPYIQGRVADGAATTGPDICLNRATPHRAQAIDFLHFMTSMEGGRIFMEVVGAVPGIVGVQAPPELEIYRSPADGYSPGSKYDQFGPGSMAVYNRNLHKLIGAQGDVEAYIAAITPGFRDVIVQDMQAEIRTLATNQRSQDLEVAALRTLTRLKPAEADYVRRVPLVQSHQTANEINVYEATAVLQRETGRQIVR